MAFPAVGVPSWSLLNALSRILCLVITMGKKKKKPQKPNQQSPKNQKYPPKKGEKKRKKKSRLGVVGIPG